LRVALRRAVSGCGIRASPQAFGFRAEGDLTHKNPPPPRTLQWGFAWVHKLVLGEGAVSYERGSRVYVLELGTGVSDFRVTGRSGMVRV
jgi:hypothetical protein